jgi:hypothetical protein
MMVVPSLPVGLMATRLGTATPPPIPSYDVFRLQTLRTSTVEKHVAAS